MALSGAPKGAPVDLPTTAQAQLGTERLGANRFPPPTCKKPYTARAVISIDLHADTHDGSNLLTLLFRQGASVYQSLFNAGNRSPIMSGANAGVDHDQVKSGAAPTITDYLTSGHLPPINTDHVQVTTGEVKIQVSQQHNRNNVHHCGLLMDEDC